MIKQIIIESAIVFTAIFLLNYFMFVRKTKNLDEKNMPLELIYLSAIHGVDPQKLNFRKFQYTYSILNSFIITTTYLLIMYLVNSMLLKVILGIIILILLIVICYGILGKYYVHKQKNSTKK